MEGQITHANGAGHEGVTVIVRAKTDDGGEGKLIGKTTTDALGDFVVTAPRPIRGRIVVTFSKSHYTDIVRELNVGDDEFPPFIAEALEKFATRKDFVMISISRDFDENFLRTFLKRSGKLDWHHVFGEAGGVEIAVEQYGVTSIPRVFIIGPDGKIAATDLEGEDIVKRVEQVLKDRGPT